MGVASKAKYKKGVLTYQDMIGKFYGGDKSRNVTFVVTERCNLACTYCYEINKNNARMSLETGKKSIDMLFKEFETSSEYLNEDNCIGIILEFIGGEPLLEIELIDQLMDYFILKAVKLRHPWANNFMISITSNGILFDTEPVQKFIKKFEGKISITITIDGNKELHDSCRIFPDGTGSYDIVKKSIQKQIAIFGNADTKVTLAPENISFFSQAVQHLYDLKISVVNANVVFENVWSQKDARILFEQMILLADWMLEDQKYKNFYCSIFDEFLGYALDDDDDQNWCGGTGKMLAIDHKGIVYPCLRYMEFSLQNQKPIQIGDLTNGISRTEEDRETVAKLNCITRKSQSTDECINCPIAKGCAWCSGYNYDEFGTPNIRATYICEMHKARVLANVYYWNKLFRQQNLTHRFKNNVPKEWALKIISEDEFEMLNELASE